MLLNAFLDIFETKLRFLSKLPLRIIKMKKIILYILLLSLQISFSYGQTNKDFSFADIENKPKAVINYYKKNSSKTISDSEKYKLACAYYFIGMNKKMERNILPKPLQFLNN